VWRLLAQLVHEPDKGTLASSAASRRRLAADPLSASSSLPNFNSLAMELINLTSAGAMHFLSAHFIAQALDRLYCCWLHLLTGLRRRD
jgi:hypothetical protein